MAWHRYSTKTARTERYSLETAVKKDKLYGYLWDSKKNDWAVNPTVRNVGVMQSGNESFAKASLQHNEWMTVNASVKTTLGPELGIGWTLGNASSDNILILKSCIGGRSLGWDLLPPGSPEEEFKTYTYAAYGESPEKWEKGTTPKPIQNQSAGKLAYNMTVIPRTLHIFSIASTNSTPVLRITRLKDFFGTHLYLHPHLLRLHHPPHHHHYQVARGKRRNGSWAVDALRKECGASYQDGLPFSISWILLTFPLNSSLYV